MSARNEVTGVEYRGKNVLRLLAAEAEHGYSDAHGWAGFRQWLDAGRVVRKGEHGTSCLTIVTVSDGERTSTKPRGFRVFHYDQTCVLGDEEAHEAEHETREADEDARGAEQRTETGRVREVHPVSMRQVDGFAGHGFAVQR